MVQTKSKYRESKLGSSIINLGQQFQVIIFNKGRLTLIAQLEQAVKKTASGL